MNSSIRKPTASLATDLTTSDQQIIQAAWDATFIFGDHHHGYSILPNDPVGDAQLRQAGHNIRLLSSSPASSRLVYRNINAR